MFVNKKVYQNLSLKDVGTSTFFRIQGIGEESCPSTVTVEVNVMGFPITCNVVNQIGTLPPFMTNTKTREEIGLLTGVNYMSKVVKEARFHSGKEQMVLTLRDATKIRAGLCDRDANVFSANRNQGLSELLGNWLANQTERFSEDVKTKELKMGEMLAVQKHRENLTYKEDRDPPYQVGLSWKREPDDTLGSNYTIATRSYRMLMRKFRRDPELKKLYKKAMQEFMDEDDVERVWEFGNQPDTYYLPHRAVVNLDRITSKHRVVLNGSSKATGKLSLNDFLLFGPSLQPDLKNLLFKTRKHKILLTAEDVHENFCKA